MVRITLLITIAVAFLVTGCPEQMVGAPCVSETDNRKFSSELLSDATKEDDVLWSIETGSVQCATHLCLTQAKRNSDSKWGGKDGEDRIDSCKREQTVENCGAVFDKDGNVEAEPVLLKFSFCSCRCQDADGNRYADNPDKYGDLCECPPSAHCVNVMDAIGGEGEEAVSEKLFGGYCVPWCIEDQCKVTDATQDNLGEVCTPSTNSEEPWLWTCEKIRQ